MKKILLSLFTFVATTVAAFAGDNLVENGGFETWENGNAIGWKSTTSASNATVSQSTDAHSGQNALLVKAGGSSNKRLASKEYTLKAGTYTISAFVKGGGQCKLGFVPVSGGQAITTAYNYEDSYFNTSATEWTEHSWEFTIDKDSTVNFVVMNPKTNGKANPPYTSTDLLIDDFSVTTKDGGAGETPELPEAPAAKGDGTLANPYNPTAALEVAGKLATDTKAENDVYIKGIISNVKFTYSTKFGTAQFSISEDGKAPYSLLCYGVYYLGNKAYDNAEDTNIKVGDEVVVCGKLMNFKGTLETANKECYLYSLNGITTGIQNATVAGNAKQTIYTIDGRKVNNAVKGVYIINGKKVIK